MLCSGWFSEHTSSAFPSGLLPGRIQQSRLAAWTFLPDALGPLASSTGLLPLFSLQTLRFLQLDTVHIAMGQSRHTVFWFSFHDCSCSFPGPINGLRNVHQNQHFSSSPVLLRQVRSRHLLATAAVDFLVLLYSGLTTITVLGYLHWFSPLVELQLRGDFATP